jgi:hypothetical protein
MCCNMNIRESSRSEDSVKTGMPHELHDVDNFMSGLFSTIGSATCNQ